LWGRPCPVEALKEVAHRKKLRLLYDAAQAFGVSHGGKMLGCFGDAEVFSFHATKFVNALEGGAVVTNDDDLAHRIRLMKDLGFAGTDRVDCVGINARMHDVSAAMGVTMLESFEEIIAINQSHYRHYRRELSDITGVSLVEYDESESCNYQFIVVEVDEDVTGLSRDQLLTVLQAENVLARRYFFPGCHNLEPYRSLFPKARLVLPETERLVMRVICLPTGSDVQAGEVEAICQLIRLAIENSTQVAEWLHVYRNQQ
jgi:dTDP-4-amino-4,6-dideoxygalactose transaminase